MAAPIKSYEAKVWDKKNVVRLPQAIVEENNLKKGSLIKVIYGKNYTAVVLIPDGLKVNERMAERISILVNEPLG